MQVFNICLNWTIPSAFCTSIGKLLYNLGAQWEKDLFTETKRDMNGSSSGLTDEDRNDGNVSLFCINSVRYLGSSYFRALYVSKQILYF